MPTCTATSCSSQLPLATQKAQTWLPSAKNSSTAMRRNCCKVALVVCTAIPSVAGVVQAG